MTAWGYVSAASLVASGALVTYLLLRPRTHTSVPLVLLMGSFVLTDLGESILRLSPGADPGRLMPWVRVEWVGISLSSGTFLHFTLNFARGRPLAKRPERVPLVYAVSAGIAPFVVATDWIVAGIAPSRFGPAAALGPGYLPAAIWYESWFLFTLVALLWAYLRSASADFRRRSRFVITILAFAVVLASGTEIFWPFFTGEPTGLGFGTIYRLLIAVVLAFSEVRLHFLEVPAITEPALAPSRVGLPPGPSYLLLSPERDPAFIAFRELVATAPGLCITGTYPPKIQRRFGLERTPVLWVTPVSDIEFAVRPQALEFEVFQTLNRFIKSNPATVVLFDGPEFFVYTNGFEAVARFLRRLNNLAAGKGSTVIAAVDPAALPEAQLSTLRGLFDEVREFPSSEPQPKTSPPRSPGAYLLKGESNAALSIYESIAPGERGVILTTKNPVRLRRRLGQESRVVWVGRSGEAGEREEGPAMIDLGAGKLATRLLEGRLQPVLLIADLEQFRLLVPFPRLLDFVKGLIDRISLLDGLLLASVNPKAIASTEFAALRRQFDDVRSLD